MKVTVIQINLKTRKRLKDHRHGIIDTYDKVINELLDNCKKKK